MSMPPFDPFRQLSNIRKEFDRFLSDFPETLQNEFNLGGIRVDVHETENEVVATCDIPGVENKEDIQIVIDNNQLKISGTINRANEVSDENMYRKERLSGSFNRTITLPVAVSEEGVKASYRNGVLEVRMPKQQNNPKKTIDIDFQ
ncbi:heat-shock protein Hsp20 [Mesobacillus campisalis]|uniref:Heat-shock protein Hsp20 n=1 Tax=Mesobacillus campisalis TaxID=1408103 RepID=A0A0M2SH76_9BACI|nr:Hsp20/alpha crystallin family protein [Mesobacillus campisalis]KKK33648.1 heat-shock protein Hsp20 [Mesobacillus campisalis]